MRRRRSFSGRRELTAVSQIDLTPLIDLAFSLLIIFMISTPLLEQAISLDLPVESAKKQVERKEQKYQVISIDLSGEYHWGTTRVSVEQLKGKIAEMAKLKDQPIVDLRADAKLNYQKVVDLIDILKQYNIEKLNLDTQVR